MAVPARTIVVTGDVTIDWLLLSEQRGGGGPVDFIWMWGGGYACRALVSAGAAASHADILRYAVREAPGFDVAVVGPEVPHEALMSPRDPGYAHTFADIAPFPRALGDAQDRAWRIAEFKGTDPARAVREDDGATPPEAVDTVMIVDHASGYRHRFPDLPALLAAGPRHVLWQTGAPLAGSPLADLLLRDHSDRLTVLTSSDELRKAGEQVGYPLSWERLTDEVLAAVHAQGLDAARRDIIVMGASGALIIDRGGENVLVFDPHSQEGDWAQRHPGIGAAYGRCLDAAVALQLTQGDDSGLVDAVKRGLVAARAAHIAGFNVTADTDGSITPFPLRQVAAALLRDSDEFASVVYRPQAGTSILSQTYGGDSLTEVAGLVAVNGIGSLPHGVPVETVGAWSSVDRPEIESLRSIRNILAEYVQLSPLGAAGAPLSIAVFGPPGAGKTFAVRQMAAALLPGRMRRLEYDLSQVPSDNELHAAFHEIRDVALQGELALVFWDEFDSPLGGLPLGWLRHFLTPMGDGRFRDTSGFHPLGPAIFVFAGGTAHSFEDFIGSGDHGAARAVKKPDFVSRLRGFVNVTGPNQQSPEDVAWPLRRALTLRSLIESRAPQMFQPGGAGERRLLIDEGVLRAFLQVPEYIHGVRSMEAVVQMSSLAGKPRFERSSLPATQQLALHVDAAVFMRLVQG